MAPGMADGLAMEMSDDDGGLRYWAEVGQWEQEWDGQKGTSMETPNVETPKVREVINVYEAINRVQADLAKEGIAKNRENEHQKYKFRGIDDIYNALAPLLAKHGLCILPRVLSRECTERTTSNKNVVFSVVCEVEFDFISMADGSRHTVKVFGEAMDSGDKATNKAMSMAYKNAVIQSFAIPTEGDNDADAHTHEVAAQMPEGKIADFLIAIEDAESMEELAKVYAAAQRVARESRDNEALRRIVEAKDNRKRELAGWCA